MNRIASTASSNPRRPWRGSLGALAWLWCISAAAAPGVELFFQEPLLGDAELSPSGKHVAMRVSQKGGHNRLAVLDVETLQSNVAVSFKDSDVAMFHWVNDDRLAPAATQTPPPVATSNSPTLTGSR